ncbi:TPA_asm: UL5.5 [Human alphaherpesvirus 1]|nr:TPA_asm: UL5.5 [Human alphaherpesvirus 1]
MLFAVHLAAHVPRVLVLALRVVGDAAGVGREPLFNRQAGLVCQPSVFVKLLDRHERKHGEGEHDELPLTGHLQVGVELGHVRAHLFVGGEQPRPAGEVGGVGDVVFRDDEAIHELHVLLGDGQAVLQHLHEVTELVLDAPFVVNKNGPAIREAGVLAQRAVADEVREHVLALADGTPQFLVLEGRLQGRRLRRRAHTHQHGPQAGRVLGGVVQGVNHPPAIHHGREEVTPKEPGLVDDDHVAAGKGRQRPVGGRGQPRQGALGQPQGPFQGGQGAKLVPQLLAPGGGQGALREVQNHLPVVRQISSLQVLQRGGVAGQGVRVLSQLGLDVIPAKPKFMKDGVDGSAEKGAREFGVHVLGRNARGARHHTVQDLVDCLHARALSGASVAGDKIHRERKLPEGQACGGL